MSVPPQPGLAPEVELLLLAASGDLGADRFARLARGPLDWERLTTLAIRSHATSAVWRRLEQIAGVRPDRFAAELQTIGVINEFRLFHIRKLLEDVITLLGAHGIAVMLLKGAALLAGGTRRPLQRGMSDLDLLVIEGSPAEAWRLCREAGWRQRYQNADQEYEEHHHLPPLLDPAGVGIGLELHRALFPGGQNALGVDEQGVIGRSRRIPLGGSTAAVPGLEDLLLHACLHFAWGHRFERHSWSTFADLHLIVADPGFDWSRFLELALRTRGGRYCYWTLRLARAGTRLPVPEQVLRALPQPSPRLTGAALERHFFAQLYDPAAGAIPERLRQALWWLAMRPERTESGKPGPRPFKPAAKPADSSPGIERKLPRSVLTLRYLLHLLFPPSARQIPAD